MSNRDLDNYITGHYGEDDPANKDDQEDTEMSFCPFCGEEIFDELGLEIHLANFCMSDQTPESNSLAFRVAKDQRGQE